jgi:hypothetical protein
VFEPNVGPFETGAQEGWATLAPRVRRRGKVTTWVWKMGDCNGLLVGGATDDGVQGWVREEIVGREPRKMRTTNFRADM